MNTTALIIQMLLIPALSPMIIGTIRKVKALMQNRSGVDILQPYRDLYKLFHKDEVISKDASWLFHTAPYFLFGVTLLLAAVVPVFFCGRHSAFYR